LSLAAKHDPAAYRYFLEGLSLLSWDIVWLGHSQGFVFGRGSWEDACDVGRNLWQLIFSTQQPATVPRTVSSRDVYQQQREEGDRGTSETASPRLTIGKLGDHSHASAHTFLGHASGKEHQRPVSLSSYTMIFDSLRKALDVEIKNAEWILLSEQEFDDGEERFDLNNNAVLLQKPDMLGRHYDQTRSILTTAMLEDLPDESPVNEPRNKGKSGWTMVKDRGNRT
jgi:Vacuolar sorting 38 and autophagy-related subunit 14